MTCVVVSRKCLVSVCLVVALTNAAAAALSGEQRRQIEALDERVTLVARLFLEKKFTESSEIVRQVQQQCEELASKGDAEGSARWSAYRVDGDDARVKSWESELPEIVKSLSQPDDFLTGKLAQERADIAAFSFVRLLTTDAARFRALLTAVRGGTDFDAAFARAYGGSPSEVARIWVQRAAKTSGASSRNR